VSPRVTIDDLTVREQAIVALGRDELPDSVAGRLGVTVESLLDLAEQYGPRGLKTTTTAILRGDRQHAGELPAQPTADRVDVVAEVLAAGPSGAVLYAAPDGVLAPGTVLHASTDPADYVPDDEDGDSPDDLLAAVRAIDAADVLDAVVPVGHAAVDRATLRMPLGRLIDADGTEVVVAWAEVDVLLDTERVLEAVRVSAQYRGGLAAPVLATVRHVFTDDGAAAIRSLAALLPGGAS
jgi:hypothetical protein